MGTRARLPIVMLTPVRPAARGNGLAMRAGLFLEGMSRRHEVRVAVVPVFGTPGPDGEDWVAGLAAGCVTLELLHAAGDSGPLASHGDRVWPTVLLSTPEGRRRAREIYPLPVLCRPLSARGQSVLAAMVQGARLVHVMRSYLAPCVDFLLDAEPRPRITLDVDELDSAGQRQLGNEEEARRFERVERYYTPRADHVFTVSAADADLVRREYGVRQVTPVLNAVREPVWPTPPPRVEHDLLFVGNLSYAPNIDAARWLCEAIRPRLGPGVTIALVGSSPAPDVLSLSRLPGVTVVADVPDVTPWYGRARIAVAPLRTGGGTRTKIVEAQAHARAVVATPLGASGLAVGEENGVIVAEGTEAFARACRELLGDPPAARRVGAAGRAGVVMAEQVIEQIDLLTGQTLRDDMLARRGDL